MGKDQTISITRALREVKIAEKSINSFTNSAIAWGFVKSKGVVVGGYSAEEVTKAVQSNKDNLVDLISKRSKIKSAIAAFNATTVIKVCDIEMTVAEAIDRKNFASVEQNVYRNISKNLLNVDAYAEKERTVNDSKLEKRINATLGNSEIDETLVATLRESFEKEFEVEAIKPCGIQKWVDDRLENIDKFIEEVDYTLSETNARSTITF